MNPPDRIFTVVAVMWNLGIMLSIGAWLVAFWLSPPLFAVYLLLPRVRKRLLNQCLWRCYRLRLSWLPVLAERVAFPTALMTILLSAAGVITSNLTCCMLCTFPFAVILSLSWSIRLVSVVNSYLAVRNLRTRFILQVAPIVLGNFNMLHGAIFQNGRAFFGDEAGELIRFMLFAFSIFVYYNVHNFIAQQARSGPDDTRSQIRYSRLLGTLVGIVISLNGIGYLAQLPLFQIAKQDLASWDGTLFLVSIASSTLVWSMALAVSLFLLRSLGNRVNQEQTN